jgi:tRNA pseudouridine38-40 synthase
MEHYQLILTYDGTDFEGFQRQGRKRTVQRALEQVLREIGWKEKTILSAGRTDTGVHAFGQVVTFNLSWRHTSGKLLKALNAKLPVDVAVRQVNLVHQDFHPRFDARARRYNYRVFTSAQRDPLRERFQWRIEQTPDLDVLKRAAEIILGCHDYSAFGKAMKPGASTQRTVFSAGWERIDDASYRFEITADAFLYHMVRRLVFLQIKAGLKRLPLTELESAVKKGKKILPGLAPACGLTLERVFYEDQDFKT